MPVHKYNLSFETIVESCYGRRYFLEHCTIRDVGVVATLAEEFPTNTSIHTYDSHNDPEETIVVITPKPFVSACMHRDYARPVLCAWEPEALLLLCVRRGLPHGAPPPPSSKTVVRSITQYVPNRSGTFETVQDTNTDGGSKDKRTD